MVLPHHFGAPLDGRFLVEHQVGEGASGAVYRALDLVDNRVVALKILKEWDEGAANPVVREAELLAGLSHPGIVKIWHAGVLDDLHLPYLAMEWLEGCSLRERQITAPLSIRQIATLGALVSRALLTAHHAGVVHRDLKPENVFLRSSISNDPLDLELGAAPVLIDFGIASRENSGHLAGTAAYMSPEQARGDALVDGRTDLFALGATLFELLVGRPPHQGASAIATLARLATTPAPRVSLFRPDVPRRLDEIVDHLLRTQPDRRPHAASEAEAAFLDCLEEDLPSSHADSDAPSRLVTSGTRLVTTLVAVGFSEPPTRDRALERLRTRGADSAPLGSDALVAHLGVFKATGGEAQAALDLGHGLADSGAAVGIATGRARLNSLGGEATLYPVGEVVDRAASLAHEAKGRELLADATTAELGRGRYAFRMRDDGSAHVGPALRGTGPERSGGAPFVGRETELSQILGAHERCRSEATSLVVSVTGPPGIGKSRLQREAIARISSLASAPRVVVQRRDAYGRRHVLGAAADTLRALIALDKGASAEEAARAIEEVTGPQTLKEGPQERLQLLSRLLVNEPFPDGMNPAGARDVLWLAMTDLVGRLLEVEPIVLVMEDLQWADTESIGWLDHLLGRTTTHPLFLLACVRPNFWPENEGRFALRDHVRLDLKPISKQAVRAIAESVLGQSADPERIEGIAKQAAGSPLFAEELARLAALGRDASHAPTIEAAIQASLDTLDAPSRDAVGRLSVLGLATWDAALVAFGSSEADALLRSLTSREILVQQDQSRFPGTKEYLFKHALVRDVAYDSLDRAHREELHALAGRWLSTLGEDAATVAGHLDLGGQSTLASDYWEIAAERALTANALADALTMAERALAFAETPTTGFRRASYLDEAFHRLDPRSADRESAVSAMEDYAYDETTRVLAEGARARFDDARGGGPEVNERLAHVRDAATRLGRSDEVARCSAALASRAAFRGDFATAEAEAKRLLDLSLHEVHGARVDAYQTLAIIRQAKGAVSMALDARRSAVQAARAASLKEREAILTTNLGFALSSVGARVEAREALQSGFVLAETIGSPAAVRHAQMNLLGWTSLYGNDRRLDAHLAETRAEADAVAASQWAAPDRSNLGVIFYRGAELLRSNSDAALERARTLLRMAVESYESLGHLDVLPVALGMRAEAERLCKRVDEARSIAGQAAALLSSGAPSLLNEAPVFLTLFKCCNDLGDEDGARDALIQSTGPLLRRLNGLSGSTYVRGFLTELPHNAELVAALESASLLPLALERALASARDS